MKKFVILFFSLLLSGVFLLFSTTATAKATLPATLPATVTEIPSTGAHYVAFVNAGSTGSRLYLYTYPMDSQSNINIPSLLDSAQVKTGISSIDPADVSSYLQPLFQIIPKDVPAGTPVNLYFLSTAGMRLLSLDQQQAIYAAVTETAKNSGLTPVIIQTIPGKMEGVFDWIALNQLLNTLGQDPEKTSGILDLGGASTEIVFNGSGMDSNMGSNMGSRNFITLNLANQTYHLYSHSYLGLGENTAQSQYMNTPSCYPVGYSLPNGNQGTGQFLHCQKRILSLLGPVQHVRPIQKFIPDQTVMNFYAISGFFYTNTSTIFNLGGQLSAQSLQNSAMTACAQTWTLLKQQDPSDPYLYATCFNAALATDLLNSYGFSPTQILNATNTIGTNTIDWTLGAAIYYLNTPSSD